MPKDIRAMHQKQLSNDVICILSNFVPPLDDLKPSQTELYGKYLLHYSAQREPLDLKQIMRKYYLEKRLERLPIYKQIGGVFMKIISKLFRIEPDIIIIHRTYYKIIEVPKKNPHEVFMTLFGIKLKALYAVGKQMAATLCCTLFDQLCHFLHQLLIAITLLLILLVGLVRELHKAFVWLFSQPQATEYIIVTLILTLILWLWNLLNDKFLLKKKTNISKTK